MAGYFQDLLPQVALTNLGLHKTEVIIGFCLLVAGAVPFGIVLLSGKMLPPTCYAPYGYPIDGCNGLGGESREVAQLKYFWFMISFFFEGIGAWFFIAGLMSRPIVSNGKPKT